MGLAIIPVDLRNPGHVFACLGFLEAAEFLCGPAAGGFDWDDDERFVLKAIGAENPVERVLAFLFGSEAKAIAPKTSQLRAKEPGVPTLPELDNHFPCPEPKTPSALPTALVGECLRTIRIDHWADGCKLRDKLKLWAGMGGYSGAALTRDLLKQIQRWPLKKKLNAIFDPFSADSEQSSSFRIDLRGSYVPLDLGFSVNEHSELKVMGYPLVELLGSIGLQNARPMMIDKLHYRYGVLGATLPVHLARATLGLQGLGFPMRRFLMTLGWPGKVGQARCILFAQEETPP